LKSDVDGALAVVLEWLIVGVQALARSHLDRGDRVEGERCALLEQSTALEGRLRLILALMGMISS
jgi:hypothetical protein